MRSANHFYYAYQLVKRSLHKTLCNIKRFVFDFMRYTSGDYDEIDCTQLYYSIGQELCYAVFTCLCACQRREEASR